MKISILSAVALVASFGLATPVLAQKVPAASVAVVDLGRVSNECNACKTAGATLQGQVSALRTRQQTLSTPIQTEGQAIQTAINALGAKQPDAALTARIRALQAKQENANQELGRQQQQIQRNQAYIQQQIDTKLGPIIDRVMQSRGANIVVEAGSALRVGAGLDVTADVLAGLNAALTSISTTAPAAPASPSSR